MSRELRIVFIFAGGFMFGNLLFLVVRWLLN